MAGREQSHSQSAPREQDVVNVDVAKATSIATNELDALLDEIDGVLESNAEEFVKGYVQKGGQ